MTKYSSNIERIRNDLYETPEWATEAVIPHLNIDKDTTVWEPCAGNHKMVNVLKKYAKEVYTSDIEEYDKKHNSVKSFLTFDFMPKEGISHIITNPPYKNNLPYKMAKKAIELLENSNNLEWEIAFLCRVEWDCARSRVDLFNEFMYFNKKIILTKRPNFRPENGSPKDNYAWYIFSSISYGYKPIIEYYVE